jgi:hypothetical protein
MVIALGARVFEDGEAVKEARKGLTPKPMNPELDSGARADIPGPPLWAQAV